MRYKSIVLDLLEQNPELHEQLRRDRKLPAALNQYSMELKKSHEAWKDRLIQAKPGSEQSQIASEAMEIALKELEDRLSSMASPDSDETFSLDAAMAYLRRLTPAE